ncbi:MAG: pyridoxamine 5'-phosphate oxidase family protein [Ferruginibacter sp.]
MISKLTEEQIEEILNKNVLGRIGCNDGNRTYVVPINYVYDGKNIIGHSMEGMKIVMMRKNPEVCFGVDEMKSITKWRSVIAWGQYQELTNERDRYYAMKLFADRMMQIKISEPSNHLNVSADRIIPKFQKNSRSVIYRIIITEKTGRSENE